MNHVSLLRRDAAACGLYCREMLKPGKRSSGLTPGDRLLVAVYAARWAGHWANLALKVEAETP